MPALALLSIVPLMAILSVAFRLLVAAEKSLKNVWQSLLRDCAVVDEVDSDVLFRWNDANFYHRIFRAMLQ